ncbi:MAG TPA: potassium/proton antiporter [Sedimentisphaerales bacterium]|nr:potassium/proton antiporter [Sedimentisphaerales bacterium]
MVAAHYVLTGISLLLLISVFASKTSERLGVPALLMFLVVGMLAGSEGIGGIYFDNAYIANLMGTMALALILFSGGLHTDWHAIRPVLGPGVALASVGVLLTAVLVGIFAAALLKLSLMEGLLLGSVVSSTDAAAVFSILRSKSVSLKGQTKPLLELESGSNDPMAVFLTMGIIRLMQDGTAPWLVIVPMFLQQVLVGSAIGLASGKAIVRLINRLKLEYEGLYPVLTLSVVLLVFAASEVFGGNGFLAVYLAGIILGNSDFLHKRSLKRFHDGTAWLMQITMFLTLGLLVFPSQVAQVWRQGVSLSVFLMFIARPASVFITLAFSRLNLREKALVSWVGLRGAVPIVLATFPLLANLPKAMTLFNLVFFITIISVLLQGKSLPLTAKWLKLDEPLRQKPQYPLEFDRPEKMAADMREIEIPPGAAAIGKRILDLRLPAGTLIVLIYRNDEFFVPTGGTVLLANDRMLVLGKKDAQETLDAILAEQSGLCPV